MQFSTLEDQSRMKTSGSTASNTGIPSEPTRSEEHTSELQSQSNLVCRLLLEKKKEFDFVQQLCLLQRRLARIDDDVILILNHALKLACAHVQHEPDARAHAFVKPDVRNRYR